MAMMAFGPVRMAELLRQAWKAEAKRRGHSGKYKSDHSSLHRPRVSAWFIMLNTNAAAAQGGDIYMASGPKLCIRRA
jgi:hypothetical protein